MHARYALGTLIKVYGVHMYEVCVQPPPPPRDENKYAKA